MSINCSECKRDLSKAEIINSYDKNKDLEICTQCYFQAGGENNGKYRGYKITHNNLKNPDGSTDGSSELIIVYGFLDEEKCDVCGNTENVYYISDPRGGNSGYYCSKQCENKREREREQNPQSPNLEDWEVKAKKAIEEKIKNGESWKVERTSKLCEKCKSTEWYKEKVNNATLTAEESDSLIVKKTNNYGDELIVNHTCQERPEQPKPDKPNENNEEEIKKYGSDYTTLKAQQKEGRQTTYQNWETKRQQNYGRQKVCRYCPQTFNWDTNLEYLPSKAKVESELRAHEASCSKKNDQQEQQRLKQIEWEKRRKKSGSPFYTCDKGCWGKVCLDKNIEDWQKAKKQAWADLAYHQKHECGNNLTNPKVPICFSPNQGGHYHVDLSYANDVNEDDLVIEQDNQTEVKYYQQQGNKDKPFNWTPWLIGIGTISLIGIIAYFWTKKKRYEAI